MHIASYEPGTPGWLDLGSPDIAASVAFYGALFGWNAIDQGSDAGGYHMFELDGRRVAGLGSQTQPGMPYWTTYVSVADVDASVERVRGAGGSVFVDPIDVLDAGRMAVCADSVGAAFSLWQPGEQIGAETVNEPNTFVWSELTTRDTDAAAAFYNAVFDWAAVLQVDNPTPYYEWQLNGRGIAGMMPMDEHFPADLPSHWMVYFAVDDVDASCVHVAELGGAVCVPPTDIAPGRFAVVNDSQGAMFSLIKMAQ